MNTEQIKLLSVNPLEPAGDDTKSGFTVDVLNQVNEETLNICSMKCNLCDHTFKSAVRLNFALKLTQLVWQNADRSGGGILSDCAFTIIDHYYIVDSLVM